MCRLYCAGKRQHDILYFPIVKSDGNQTTESIFGNLRNKNIYGGRETNKSHAGGCLDANSPTRRRSRLAGEHLILGEHGGKTRRMIDEFFAAANVKPNVVMELSRQEAINKMVENQMGVGIAGAKTVAREIREKKLVSWQIEKAKISWDLGLARLQGRYFSPIEKEFVNLCRESFLERENDLKATQ